VDDLVKNGRFDEAATDLRQTLAQIDALIASQSDNLRAIVGDLRVTIENTRQMTDDVKSDPSRLILAQPPPHTTYGSGR
jgi:ABC-type transporter Mla subunit MlaD